MKRKHVKQWVIIWVTIIILPVSLFAHSGRIDSRGGHKDNKNKSGLGAYHYHCGEYPAHLHSNGVCPYSSATTTISPNSNNSKNSGINSAKSTPIYIEKEEIFFIDDNAVKINTINVDDSNLVELKTLCEKLEIVASYDSTLKTIDCKKGNISFTLQIDSKNFWLNGELSTLNVAPMAHKGRTMIPARIVAEAIGKTVTYDGVNKQIVIQ